MRDKFDDFITRICIFFGMHATTENKEIALLIILVICFFGVVYVPFSFPWNVVFILSPFLLFFFLND